MIDAGGGAPAWRGSLRLRLLLGTLGWIALTIVAAGLALGGLFRQHVASAGSTRSNCCKPAVR